MGEPHLTRQLKRDAFAAAVGILLAFSLVIAWVAFSEFVSRADCSGEFSPSLGSGAQTFAVHGCLAKNAGPLIALKMRLGIYDPTWKPVIR